MARLKLTELMTENNISPIEMAKILWPDSPRQSQRVLIGQWMSRGVVSVRLDQLQALHDRFGVTNLIEYEEVEP